MTPHDDAERDAWLTQALRHAPDADAAPPAELGETILRAARNAVKASQAAAPARANPLGQLWSWLARPSVAAGFATVMVATLVGVMWWDKPLDETLPQAAAPATTATAERNAAPPAAVPAAPEPSQAQAELRVEKEAPRAAARPAPPAPAQPARKRAAEPPAAVTADASSKRSADAATPMAAAPSAFPATAPPPAPAPAAAPAPARENAATSSGALARDERDEQRAERPSALAKSAAPAAGLSARRQDAAPAASTTLAIDEPERWRWQRGAGPQPMTPALQRWLAQLDRTARWRPATGAPPAAAAADVLQLWRDGALHTTIQLGDDAVWLTPAGGAPLMAPLAPAAAASLKTTLADAAP